MTITLLWLYTATLGAEPPKSEAPSVAVVRQALKRHYERIANRRVKYVIKTLPGEPRKDFPPVDAPDRAEVELVVAADGRFREKKTRLKSGAVASEVQMAFDGAKTTQVDWHAATDGRPARGEATVTAGAATIGTGGTTREELDRWARPSEPLHERLGIRAEVTVSPDDPRHVLLDPSRDDRALVRKVFVLDVSKDYWPVELRSEDRQEKGPRRVGFRTRAVELQETPKGPYIKRMVTWMGGPPDQTWYYTVTAVEFPETFDAAEFTVAIPHGTSVRDDTTGARYRQGIVEKPREPRRPTLTERLQEIPGEDWLFYGGFTATVMSFVGLGWYLMSRGRKPPANG